MPRSSRATPLELRNGRIASRALDNRLGCYVALEVARRIAEQGGAPGDVAGLAVVQEEVGDFAGARTAAFVLEPAVAIAVDVTHATDVRGGDPEDEGDNRLGGGAAIMRGPTDAPAIFELLYETAEAERIPFSIEVSRGHTNTDADAVYLSRVGVATGLVSIPLRYMHTPVESVDLDDVEAVVAAARRVRAAARARDVLRALSRSHVVACRTVIVSAVRTPFGQLGGGLKDHAATELGAIAIRAALERERARGRARSTT